MSGDGLQGAGEDGGESGRGTGVSREGLHRRERTKLRREYEQKLRRLVSKVCCIEKKFVQGEKTFSENFFANF